MWVIEALDAVDEMGWRPLAFGSIPNYPNPGAGIYGWGQYKSVFPTRKLARKNKAWLEPQYPNIKFRIVKYYSENSPHIIKLGE